MNLKEARKKRGLTQGEAAEMFGLKFRTYQNYENGVTSPTMEKAAEFARFFGCSIAELFCLEDGCSVKLSKEEVELIRMFRSLDGEHRQSMMLTARAFANTAKKMQDNRLRCNSAGRAI